MNRTNLSFSFLLNCALICLIAGAQAPAAAASAVAAEGAVTAATAAEREMGETTTEAAIQTPSDFRSPDESYLNAFFRWRRRNPAPLTTQHSTPWSEQKYLDNADIGRAPVIDSLAALQTMFERARDAREWRWNVKPEFARRIPWLYVEDGCFLRAELIVQKFREWGYPVPKQAMAFGDLHATTPFGAASWWYHVAPVVRVANQAYVLDPSVDSRAPIPLDTWMLKMVSGRNGAQVAICNSDVVDPDQDCAADSSAWSADYQAELTQQYLGAEWSRLESFLGAEPIRILGDEPPWRAIFSVVPQTIF